MSKYKGVVCASQIIKIHKHAMYAFYISIMIFREYNKVISNNNESPKIFRNDLVEAVQGFYESDKN